MKRPATRKLIFWIVCVCFGFGGATFIARRSHPNSEIRLPTSEISSFTPDPLVQEIVAAGNPWGPAPTPEPWLLADTTDKNVPPGESSATTILRTKAQPVVTKDGAYWKITFK